MNIIYKRTRRVDLDQCANLIKLSFNHLRLRTGKSAERFPRGHPFSFEHFLKTDPGFAFCAWHGSKLVGFTQALNRGKQWYLAFLFVHPKYQDQKVGKELLSRVWRDEPGVSHSLATFSYNSQAIGIYGRFGMAPISGIVRLQVPKNDLILLKSSSLHVRSEITRADLGFINDLESRVRGYARPIDWERFFSQEKFHRFVFLKDGKRVGYSVVTDTGLIGPAGAVTSGTLTQVILRTLHEASQMKTKNVYVHAPAENIRLYQTLLKSGFRIREMLLFVSDRRYPDLQRYVPAPLAMF